MQSLMCGSGFWGDGGLEMVGGCSFRKNSAATSLPCAGLDGIAQSVCSHPHPGKR